MGAGEIACGWHQGQARTADVDELLQPFATLSERQSAEVLVAVAQQIEHNECGGRRGLDPSRGQPSLQGLKVQVRGGHHHEFSVDNGADGQFGGQDLDNVREPRGQRALLPGLQLNSSIRRAKC